MLQVHNIQHLEVNKSDNWYFPLLPGSQWNIINQNRKQIEYNNVGVNQYAACIAFISKICPESSRNQLLFISVASSATDSAIY